MNRRPKLTIVAPDASDEEAAAVVAALEHFMRDTAASRAELAPRRSPWLEAALREGVNPMPGPSLSWD